MSAMRRDAEVDGDVPHRRRLAGADMVIPLRPWYEKWANVLTALADLQDAYYCDAKSLGRVAVEHRVTKFFGECNDLKDWLTADRAHLPGLVGSDVETFARGNTALKICAGMADMHEPDTHTPNEEATRILFVDLSHAGATVVLAYARPGSEQGRCDALMTAENCVDAWRRFLKKHGIIAT